MASAVVRYVEGIGVNVTLEFTLNPVASASNGAVRVRMIARLKTDTAATGAVGFHSVSVG